MKNKIFTKACRGILLTLSLLAYGGLLSLLKTGSAIALNNQTYDTDFFENHYSSFTSLATSTHSVVGMGTSFEIYVSTPNATGPGVLYQVVYSTYTTGVDAAGNFMQGGKVFMSSSTTGAIPPNVLWTTKLWMEAPNPKIILSGLSTQATGYIQIDYGQVRTNH